MFERYHAAYKQLVGLSNLEVTWAHSSPATLLLSLKRVRELLKRLGSPEKSLHFIHVTGTSGKGSVTNLMHDILLANGAKVASYNSPHTTTYLERFRIGDKLAHPEALATAIETTLEAHEAHIRAGKEPLSFFELSLCISLVLFVQEGAKWCVLEVGMGGRFDASNVIPAPAVAIITNIDLDHVQFFGPTKKHVAYEKAGIIKPGSIVITGETERGPLNVIKAEAKQAKAPLLVVPNDLKDHRQHNADICRIAADVLHIPSDIVENTIRQHKSLPCRLEIIQEQPRVIIDGAHNAAKIAATIKSLPALSKGKVHLIFGSKKGKDAAQTVKGFKNIITSVRTTRFTVGHGRPENPATLLKYFPKQQQAGAFLTPTEALADALKQAKKTDTILVTGSLYLAGEIRAHWRSEEVILKEQKS